MQSPDMLEAFMAEVQEGERDSIRQLVHGMRLFALSAQKDLSPRVDLPMIAAKNALRSLQSGKLQACLDLILDRTLRMAGVGIGQGAFGAWPESAWLPGASDVGVCTPEEDARRLAGAWSYLRGAVPEGIILPMPGVSWRRSVERVLSIAAQLGMPRAWVRLWKLRLEWVLKGPDCAEKSLGRWSDKFGSDASADLLEAVALHRATLAFGRGHKDQARSYLDGIQRTETGGYSTAHKALMGLIESEGFPSIGVGANGRSAFVGKSGEGNGKAGQSWSWDGLWGVQGCWVARCSTDGQKRWMRLPGRVQSTGTAAEPDALERRALRSLRVEYALAPDSGGVALDGRIATAVIRACVCVWEDGVGESRARLVPGRALGWVTWEWNQGCIPPANVLMQAARCLLDEWPESRERGVGGSLLQPHGGPAAGLCMESWFRGLVESENPGNPIGVWHRKGQDWLGVLPGGADESQMGSICYPLFEDLQRCALLGLQTAYWASNELLVGELTPILEGSQVTAVVAWEPRTAQTLDRANDHAVPSGETLPNPGEFDAGSFDAAPYLWSLARTLDEGSSRAGAAVGLPIGEPSFADFVRRLGVASSKPQHLALIGNGRGLGGLLGRWIQSREARGGWTCTWIQRDTGEPDSCRETLENWESKGDPYQVFHMPDLMCRRNEIVGWIHHVSMQQDSMVTWDDGALAAMWRQSWLGQEPQLESVISSLIQMGPGPVTRELVERKLVERGIEIVTRLESKRPLASDVASALYGTRRTKGRWNKTRASVYLGWDPDTLVARMQDFGWVKGPVPELDPWGVGSE